MIRKANYTIVGLFVVVFGFFITVSFVWLWSKHGEAVYHTYVTFFSENVTGLSEQSTVRFNGVPVGYVKKIQLDPHDAQRVRVIVKIRSRVPVTTATTATLMSQGVTGLAYIGLSTKKRLAAKLMAKPGYPYPVIASEPSLIVEVSDMLRDVSNNISAVSHDIRRIINDKNSEALSKTIQQLPLVFKQANAALAQTDNTMGGLSQQVIPAFMKTTERVNGLIINLQLLTQQFRNNPSMLIRGKPPAPLGPGEHQ